jgi:hypothetical protein
MSTGLLALFAWLLVISTLLAFHVGRYRGRAELAAQVLRDFGPILPMLEDLSAIEGTRR